MLCRFVGKLNIEKELVHFRFCRQENPEGNFQNQIQLFFM
eukprot:UN08660